MAGRDIRQILIETQGLPSPRDRKAMFSKEINPLGGGAAVEFGFVKLRPDFWRDDDDINDNGLGVHDARIRCRY